MASYFAVIRFIPNAVTDEAINVGVLLASGAHIEIHALQDWARVKAFAGASWRDVRRLVDDMSEDPAAFLGIESVDSVHDLRQRLSEWTRAVQFSDVHASLASVNELAAEIPEMILGRGEVELSPSGRRATVLRAMHHAVVSAYELRFSRKPRGIIRKGATVPGQKAQHKVDLGVVNGHFYAGAFALSFATSQSERQWRDTDAVAFAIEDMMVPREALAVVLDPPIERSEPYERAQDLFARLKVSTVGLDRISEWATKAVTAVPESALHA